MAPYVMVQEDDLIYDLYGVVNHSGSLTGGHYTAQCYNEIEKEWYGFNDSLFGKIKPDKDSIPKSSFAHGLKLKDDPEKLEEWRQDIKAASVSRDIITPRAYVLFYKRRNFKCATPEEFDKIKVVSQGTADHLLKMDTATKPSPSAKPPKSEESKKPEGPIADEGGLESAANADIHDLQ